MAMRSQHRRSPRRLQQLSGDVGFLSPPQIKTPPPGQSRSLELDCKTEPRLRQGILGPSQPSKESPSSPRVKLRGKLEGSPAGLCRKINSLGPRQMLRTARVKGRTGGRSIRLALSPQKKAPPFTGWSGNKASVTGVLTNKKPPSQKLPGPPLSSNIFQKLKQQNTGYNREPTVVKQDMLKITTSTIDL
uniref:Uncharacterized protein n=1 Tax=Asparagus officinalis TaxID=4686 RepID=Q2AA46_ASPOF|nr:hypothetical protein 19.t00015 [Asparagus officinalis]